MPVAPTACNRTAFADTFQHQGAAEDKVAKLFVDQEKDDIVADAAGQ
jgi:hypothetical protein